MAETIRHEHEINPPGISSTPEYNPHKTWSDFAKIDLQFLHSYAASYAWHLRDKGPKGASKRYRIKQKIKKFGALYREHKRTAALYKVRSV